MDICLLTLICWIQFLVYNSNQIEKDFIADIIFLIYDIYIVFLKKTIIRQDLFRGNTTMRFCSRGERWLVLITIFSSSHYIIHVIYVSPLINLSPHYELHFLAFSHFRIFSEIIAISILLCWNAKYFHFISVNILMFRDAVKFLRNHLISLRRTFEPHLVAPGKLCPRQDFFPALQHSPVNDAGFLLWHWERELPLTSRELWEFSPLSLWSVAVPSLGWFFAPRPLIRSQLKTWAGPLQLALGEGSLQHITSWTPATLAFPVSHLCLLNSRKWLHLGWFPLPCPAPWKLSPGSKMEQSFCPHRLPCSHGPLSSTTS